MSAKSSNVSTKTFLITDSSGLPLDLWRAILSFLHVIDLCRCAQVCRSWAYIVKSLDISAWKRFYLDSNQWKHPHWPRCQERENSKSWRYLYREHFLATKWWSTYNRQPTPVHCFAPLRRKKDRRVIHVGANKTHTTLRSALNVATEYDQIVLHPGLYDEQFEMSSKIPFELVGEGKPGAVILIMSIEQNATTGRLCNLVLKPPWFTEHVLKVSTGHLQIDNCQIEEGQVMVQHPATVHFRYCSFSRVQITFNHVNISAIENCDLKQSTLSVEGYPKESISWSNSYLLNWAHKSYDQDKVEDDVFDEAYYQLYSNKITEDSISSYTAGMTGASSTFEVNKSEVDSIGVASIDCHSSLSNSDDRGSDFSSESDTLITSDSSSFVSNDSDGSKCSEDCGMILSDRCGHTTVTELPSHTKGMVRSTTRNDILVSVDQEIIPSKLMPLIEHDGTEPVVFYCDNLTNNIEQEDLLAGPSQLSAIHNNKDIDGSPIVNTETNNTTFNNHSLTHHQSSNQEGNITVPPDHNLPFSVPSCHNKSVSQPGQSTSNSSISQPGQSPTSNSLETAINVQQLPSISISSRSKLTSENLPLPEVLEQSTDESEDSGSDSDSTDDMSALIKVHGKHGRISPLWSSDSESLLEAKLETAFRSVLKEDKDLINMIHKTQGPIIRNCMIHSGPGGIKVSQQGECRVEHTEFKDLQYGIRCLQNAKVAIVENAIHHCQTSGIFMRLAAHGVILGNDIYCTNEAGIDVRRNADPIIQSNRIHHSKRSGIAVLGSGCGMIKGNDIYQNREAGVYVLYKGNPYIVGNRICRGGAAGISINENGLGYIIDNFISNNRWGGIDIRNGSEPTVCRNLICNGLADGIVIGHKGRGILEGNTIKGNDGCGIWVMGGQPLIQMNQIYNNNNTGVSFAMDREAGELEHDHDSDSLSESSDVDVSLIEEWPSNGRSAHLLHPQLKYNTIFHNNGYGVLSCCNEQLILHGNAIHDNKDVGVLVKQEETVNITSNSITSNSGVGIHVSEQSKVLIEGNGVYDNTEHGLLIEGEAVITSNDVFCNEHSALVMSHKALVKVQNNRIHAPTDTGVKTTDSVQGEFFGNQLYTGTGKIVDLGKKSHLQMQQNDIVERNCKKNGYHVQDWHLENPPARPHIAAPPRITPQAPSKRVSMVTRVVVPSTGPCQQSSKLCTIL